MQARAWCWVAGAWLASMALACSGDDAPAGAQSGGSNADGSAGKAAMMSGGRSGSRASAGSGSGSSGSSGRTGTMGGSGNPGGSSDPGGSGNPGGSGDPGGSLDQGGSTAPVNATASAKELAQRLGRTHFMIGMGNDLDNNHDRDGAYTLGVTMDTHDAYLVGLKGMGGWPDWNPDGSFVNALADAAKRHNTVPMYTLYSMAAWGEGDPSVLVNDDYMRPYWDGAKLLFQRIAMFGEPAIVHIEPDFWAFMEHQGDPSGVKVHVGSLASDCSGQPDTLVGYTRCMIALGRKYAPKALLGLHASVWADADGAKVAAYLKQVGAGDTDFIGVDMLDRDAGCFEAHTDPNCQRNDGPWYWDASNKTSPNFHDHFAWAKKVGDGLEKPILWWQVPFGVPSETPGGSADHYRDNRVKYIFEHIDELVAAGGVGVSFGVGVGNQTYITTDGGQFKTAVTKYFAAPTEL